jgi:HEAT repeat protein
MNDSANHEHFLEFLKDWKNGLIELDHSSAWRMAHDLAEIEYQPAIDFFAMGLNDTDWVWRQECVQFLGFHYRPLAQEIIESVRILLLGDPSEDVRVSAAAVLGRRSRLPDQALFRALQFDSSSYVKLEAFESILELIGLPQKEILQEIKKLREGTIQPTLEYIKQLVSREGIEISEGLLTMLD